MVKGQAAKAKVGNARTKKFASFLRKGRRTDRERVSAPKAIVKGNQRIAAIFAGYSAWKMVSKSSRLAVVKMMS
jgi:hypothetical protein